MNSEHTPNAPIHGREPAFFAGVLDEVAIFPWELSPENIADIAAVGLQQSRDVSPSGKVAAAWGALKERE